MKKTLLDYMIERFGKDLPLKKMDATGPVITISRQKGCGATFIAQELVKRISDYSDNSWRYINRELLNETALELGLDLEGVKSKIQKKDESFIEGFFTSLSRTYKEEGTNVKRILKHLVQTVAEDGNAVIVGRGGAAIASNIKMSLHVQLFADIEYRKQVLELKKNSKLTISEINSLDSKRQNVLSSFSHKDSDRQLFDIIINTERFTPEAIVDIILKASKMKGII